MDLGDRITAVATLLPDEHPSQHETTTGTGRDDSSHCQW